MEKVCVLGAGLMGHSIALNAAWQGGEVKLFGMDDADLDRARKGVAAKLATMSDCGLIVQEEIAPIERRILYTTSLSEAAADCSFVIEAVPENLQLKINLFCELDAICPAHVILASNTSGLSPTAIASQMKRPEQMAVVHFWNPAHLIPLVEVVGGERTDRETIDRAITLLRDMKKQPIEVKRDVPGFVGNRLQYALFREAQALLDAGVASKEDIDAAVVYSIGRRLPITGPLMSADLGGLDVFHAISEYLFPDLDKSDGSLPTMKSLVEGGNFGLKTGSGFYEWDDQSSAAIRARREELLIEFLKKDLDAPGS